jgi:hypothetical protein
VWLADVAEVDLAEMAAVLLVVQAHLDKVMLVVLE